jgi:hypothetical protein
MLLRNLFESANKTAVLGWGRGMGHKGHMLLAQAVLHHAQENNAKPFFVVSRTSLVDPATGQPWADKPTFTKTKDDPLTPEEKLATYRKVFPQNAEVFSVASADATKLEQVIAKIAREGFTKVVLVVGEDQKTSMAYLTRPDKSGVTPYKQAGISELEIISRQDTTEPSSAKGSPDYQEGPRATPMRQVLLDPAKSEEEQFAVWRRDMPDNLSDEEVKDLMLKAKQRMSMVPASKRGKAVPEGSLEANTPDPVVVIQDQKGNYLDKINLSVAAQKYRLGNPQDIKKQLAHQNYTTIGNYVVVAPMSGQPQDKTTQGMEDEGIMGFLARPHEPVKKKSASPEEMRKYFEKERVKATKTANTNQREPQRVYTRYDEAHQDALEGRVDEFLPALAAGAGALARGTAVGAKAVGGAALKGAQAVGGAALKGARAVTPSLVKGAQSATNTIRKGVKAVAPTAVKAGQAISKVPGATEKGIIRGFEVLNALVPGGIFDEHGYLKGTEYLRNYIDQREIQQLQKEYGQNQQQGVAEAPMSAAVRWQRAMDRQRAKSDASLRRTPSSIPKKEEPKKDEKIAEKIKGADGKACWKGKRYAGTKNGKDVCIPVSEDVENEMASLITLLENK